MTVDLSRDTRLTILAILLTVFVASFTTMPVKAATFDGTYNFAYNWYYSPNREWRTVRVSSGFIVRNGRISSNPPGLSGSVYSSGNVRFTGPCPYGGHNTVYTGVIRSGGTGEGSYRCGYRGHPNPGGRWSVTRVSGSGSTGALSIFDMMIIGVGTIAVLGVSIGIARILSARLHGKKPTKEKKFTTSKPAPPTVSPDIPPSPTGVPYQASQPAPPSASHEIPPSTIGVPSPPASPEAGVSVGPSPLPSTLSLGVAWTAGLVNLTWSPPPFDNSVYQLVGYDVSRIDYVSTSTAPVKTFLTRLPPGTQGWTGAHYQSYRWNTRGDIEGYVVEAVLRHTSSTGHVETYRVGAMAYSPYPPSV